MSHMDEIMSKAYKITVTLGYNDMRNKAVIRDKDDKIIETKEIDTKHFEQIVGDILLKGKDCL